MSEEKRVRFITPKLNTELTVYADTGCLVHPACLSCPLPDCYPLFPVPKSYHKKVKK
jgi:hypothetical protein